MRRAVLALILAISFTCSFARYGQWGGGYGPYGGGYGGYNGNGGFGGGYGGYGGYSGEEGSRGSNGASGNEGNSQSATGLNQQACKGAIANANRAFSQLINDVRQQVSEWEIYSDLDAVDETSYYLANTCNTQDLDVVSQGKNGQSASPACKALGSLLQSILEQDETEAFRGDYQRALQLSGKALRLGRSLGAGCQIKLVKKQAQQQKQENQNNKQENKNTNETQNNKNQSNAPRASSNNNGRDIGQQHEDLAKNLNKKYMNKYKNQQRNQENQNQQENKPAASSNENENGRDVGQQHEDLAKNLNKKYMDKYKNQQRNQENQREQESEAAPAAEEENNLVNEEENNEEEFSLESTENNEELSLESTEEYIVEEELNNLNEEEYSLEEDNESGEDLGWLPKGLRGDWNNWNEEESLGEENQLNEEQSNEEWSNEESANEELNNEELSNEELNEELNNEEEGFSVTIIERKNGREDRTTITFNPGKNSDDIDIVHSNEELSLEEGEFGADSSDDEIDAIIKEGNHKKKIVLERNSEESDDDALLNMRDFLNLARSIRSSDYDRLRSEPRRVSHRQGQETRNGLFDMVWE